MEGWIKLHRNLLQWEWYDDANTLRVFLHLLLTANHAPKKWRGIAVDKGQRITSPSKLAEELGLSVQNVRTSLNKLKSTGEINLKSTNKFTLLSICNYATYQSEKKPANKQLTNNQQTTNKQLTTNKNDKNEKKGAEGQFFDPETGCYDVEAIRKYDREQAARRQAIRKANAEVYQQAINEA